MACERLLRITMCPALHDMHVPGILEPCAAVGQQRPPVAQLVSALCPAPCNVHASGCLELFVALCKMMPVMPSRRPLG